MEVLFDLRLKDSRSELFGRYSELGRLINYVSRLGMPITLVLGLCRVNKSLLILNDLRELGIEPMARVRFRTIEGRVIEGDIGETIIECMGKKATTIVVFAQEGDAEVLGAYSLEGFRLKVDPVIRQLKKVEALLAL